MQTPPQQTSETRGTVALVCGILSIVAGSSCLPALLGIPAWMIGNQVMQAEPEGSQQYEHAKWGRILGLIGLGLGLLGVLLFVGYFGLVFLLAALGH